MDVLEGVPNRFEGIELKPDALPDDPNAFRVRLGPSLMRWTEEGYKVVWIEIPIHKAILVPIAAEAGFTFHHSSTEYLMMTCKLVDDAFVPLYATHYIGAGGVVINEREELLVVCERFRSGRPPYYKLPGGALHPSEHLASGVIREVFEETGVPTRFDALVCFRHWHGYRYNKSDIYFVCRLRPLHQIIEMQTAEIEECLWMPVKDYMLSEHVSQFNKLIVKAAVESPGLAQTWVDGYGDPDRYEFFMPE
jgi:8-oxo-dGTP pyrophosphatase MutT (NUDIX family)